MTSWTEIPPTREDLENRIDELETLLKEASEVIGILRMYEGPSIDERANRVMERIGLTVAS